MKLLIALMAIATFAQEPDAKVNTEVAGPDNSPGRIRVFRNHERIASVDAKGNCYIIEGGKPRRVSRRTLIRFVETTDRLNEAVRRQALAALKQPVLTIYGAAK